MIGKMILQGMAATAIVATMASLYSAAAQPQAPADAATVRADRPAAGGGTGYLPVGGGGSLSADRGTGYLSASTGARTRYHDDDDDDDHDDHHHDRRHHGDRESRR